jgi:hypothetical protein
MGVVRGLMEGGGAEGRKGCGEEMLSKEGPEAKVGMDVRKRALRTGSHRVWLWSEKSMGRGDAECIGLPVPQGLFGVFPKDKETD